MLIYSLTFILFFVIVILCLLMLQFMSSRTSGQHWKPHPTP